jgi:hypothetical protein
MSSTRLIVALCIAAALLSAMCSAQSGTLLFSRAYSFHWHANQGIIFWIRTVPTFTMLNFDVNQNGTLIDPQLLLANLQKLKQRANIDGILCDVRRFD